MLKDNRGLAPGHHMDALCSRWSEDYARWQQGGVGEGGTGSPWPQGSPRLPDPLP